MILKKILTSAALSAGLLSGYIYGQQEISYADLVNRVTDLDYLTAKPLDGEKSGSATSHDRKSAYDSANEEYIQWYANDDGKGFIRKEGEDTVIADIEGPGVIWRIWTAHADKGDIKFYIDGAETPVLQMPFGRVFDNTKEPFAYSNLNVRMAAGLNLFVPIPFQKSLKIALAPGWGNYFQATYTTFPNGTKIPSFTGNFSAEETAALERANRIIAMRENRDFLIPSDAETISKTVTLAPKKTFTQKIDGSGEIVNLSAKISGDYAPEEMRRILRECTITINWDDEKSPSVWAPLGDFFGTANGINPFHSIPLSVHKDGTMTARWRMPFADGAKIVLQNDGKTPVKIEFSVSTRKVEKEKADNLLRFHAKWHRNNFGKKGERYYLENRWPDWPMLIVDSAAGRYAGMSIDIWNPNSNWNPIHKKTYEHPEPEGIALPESIKHGILNDFWWGEGDEKFFVDGEKFPSTYGTGFEDYIGYAWGTPHLFDSHTQVQSKNHENYGHICIARFHIADNVPFQKSFEAAVEKYHGDNWPLQFAITAYWYQQKGAADIYGPQPLEERVGAEKTPTIRADIEKAKLAFRARAEIDKIKFADFKSMALANKSDDLGSGVQDMTHWGVENWVDGRQILLSNFTVGKFATFIADAPDSNAKKITLVYTQAPDYADIEIEINGKKSAAALPGFAPEVRTNTVILPEKFAPKNGKFEITVRAVSNRHGTFGGLDRIEFE